MKAKGITALCLCAVVLFFGMLSGCVKGFKGKTQPSEQATVSVTETTQPTTVGETTAVPASVPETETQGSNESDENSDVQDYEPPVSADPDVCVITVASKDHKVNVGDIVTYTCYLKTPKMIEDVQGKIIYTGASLKLIDTDIEGLFPVLGDITICNTETPNLIRFNAVKIGGIDFTSKDVLVTLRFKVTTGVSASVATTVEYLTEKGGKSYIEDCKPDKKAGILIEETLK